MEKEIINDDIQKFENELMDFFEKISDTIFNKYDLFFRKFNNYSSFIKIPEIFWLKLYHYQEFYKEKYHEDFDINFEFSEIYGITVCPTSSINTLEEIEVF